MTKLMPTRTLAVLLLIGTVDLVLTAILHANGLIIELNPLMRPLLERSEWLFALVKGGTMLIAWATMAAYAQVNLAFVRRACLVGSIAYVGIWCAWFFSSV
jgi:hypothetical protein